MELASRLKHLIFEDDQTQQIETNQPSKIEPIQPQPVIQNQPIIADTSINVDSDIEKTLEEALNVEKNNNPSFDYLNFKKLLTSLTKTISDERTRYQSANEMALTMNVDATQLINSANKYLNCLQQEESLFKQTLQDQFVDLVTNKEQETQNIEKEIQEISEQVKALTLKIDEKQQYKKKLIDEIADNKAQIEKTQNKFYSTYTNFIQKIKNDIEKISMYLGSTNV